MIPIVLIDDQTYMISCFWESELCIFSLLEDIGNIFSNSSKSYVKTPHWMLLPFNVLCLM